MIEVEGLTRYYGTFPAIEDISFTIGQREIVGLLGLNGAGKSTTLKILAGLMLPSAGSVRIAGVDALRAPASLRRKIGFLPEDPPLYREMRVDEFLRWCGRIRGMDKSAVEARMKAVAQTCQLDDVLRRIIGELSHGYRKRVGIAQAIIHSPELVILDEPISGLDPKQIVAMREVVRSLASEATVMISSHILSEIAQTCDRILVIEKGRLVAEGSEDELARRLDTVRRVNLLVRGAKGEIESVLGALEGVRSFTIQDGRDGQEGVREVEALLTEDIREGLIESLVRAGIGVRGLQAAEGELEQIFLQLTRSADERNEEARA